MVKDTKDTSEVWEDVRPVFKAMERANDYFEREVVPHITLEDEEADAALRRNFFDCRVLYYRSPNGSAPHYEGGTTLGKLSGITNAYRLGPEDAGPIAARAWWALQNAAFVVKQDLVKMAEYAARLEAENRRLRAQLPAE